MSQKNNNSIIFIASFLIGYFVTQKLLEKRKLKVEQAEDIAVEIKGK